MQRGRIRTGRYLLKRVRESWQWWLLLLPAMVSWNLDCAVHKDLTAVLMEQELPL